MDTDEVRISVTRVTGEAEGRPRDPFHDCGREEERWRESRLSRPEERAGERRTMERKLSGEAQTTRPFFARVAAV